jgi:phosphatidylglycerophosphate synthase
MLNPKHWPNIVSGVRLALLPAVLAAALAGSRRWFVILLGISLATDVLDGFLARRLKAYSEFGRKLDSVADYLTLLVGLGGIALLWPREFERELPWIVAGMSAFLGVLVLGFVRLGRAPCYHSWAAKVGAVACALSLIPLLGGYSARPFHVAIGLQLFAACDEVVIALLLPAHVGEMPSAWHAWRLRRAKRTA